ncbi:MAG TPA: (2Fe-2S) ferredoxin domain-containing protein [Selenomonadales bacterium]|nr:(2Fe-2S) ferredoxin domain-containing protein [Selenomonadales bacterium]
MNIYVCIGSSCHQRSSYAVMRQLKAMIAENRLGNSVFVSSAFCLGHCAAGVTIQIDDEIITGVGMGNIADIFQDRILAAVR